MPDYSPWGAAAMGGLGAYGQPPQPAPNPMSGAAAGAGAMPQIMGLGNAGIGPGMNPGLPTSPGGYGGFIQNSPAGGSMGGSSLAGIQGNGGFQGPGMTSNGFGPFGSPMGGPPGINGQAGGPFGQQRPPMQGNMMSLLLPMILQRMGMVNRPGGAPNGALPGGMNTQAGMGIQGPPGQGGPMPSGAFTGGPTGLNSPYGSLPPQAQGPGPQRIMQGMPPQAPPMQTKSPFDMLLSGGNNPGGPSAAVGQFNKPAGLPDVGASIMPMGQIGGPAGNATGAGQFNSPPPLPSGIPMGLQTQANQAFGAGPQAPPPQQIMMGQAGPGKVQQDPAAQMAEQQRQMQIANSLTNMGQMNPTQNMMAQLLMQQMPFMYR